jgi:hypothetical protein
MAIAVGFSAEGLNEANQIGCSHLVSGTQCLRCGGFMVTEQCFDLLARRCVQCGELVDPVILQNRDRRPLSGLGNPLQHDAENRRTL